MSEPDRAWFACLGCGSMIPGGSDLCPSCREQFAGTDVQTQSPIELPAMSENSFDLRIVPIRGGPTRFRIGTMMTLIALIGVCLGAFTSHIALGWLVTLSLIPITIRTLVVINRREAQGRLLTLSEKLATFVLSIIDVFLIAMSSVITFGLTCFPIGSVAANAESSVGLVVAIGTGLVAAIAAGIWVWRTLIEFRQVGEEDRRSNQPR